MPLAYVFGFLVGSHPDHHGNGTIHNGTINNRTINHLEQYGWSSNGTPNNPNGTNNNGTAANGTKNNGTKNNGTASTAGWGLEGVWWGLVIGYAIMTVVMLVFVFRSDWTSLYIKAQARSEKKEEGGGGGGGGASGGASSSDDAEKDGRATMG